jgi:hypothetical protein
MNISTQGSPYFTLDAKASFLGLVNEQIDARIDNNGISFELEFGSIIQSHMQCQIKSSGNFNGSFSYGPDLRVPLPSPLGSIHLVDTISAALGLAISGDHIEFSVGGGFDFEGISMNFGPVDLDINISSISDVISACDDYIIDNASKIFLELFKEAAKWAEWAFKGTINEVENIASGLKSYFNETINDAAKILNGIDMPVQEAAFQLKGAFDASADVLADALKLGFGLEETAVATYLKGLDYSADQIGEALHSVFGIDGQATAQVLKDIGIPVEQITKVLSDIFSLSPNTISDVLKGVGYPVTIIADIFKAIGGPFADVGNALENALNEVAHNLNPSNW